MKACRWLLFGMLFLLGGIVHAEGNCPPGYYPIGTPPGQGGPQGCAPIPGENNNSQQQVQNRPPPPQWTSRWGAIATDGEKGSLGTITGAATRSEAEQEAMTDCQSKGGSHCKIDVSYSNGCAAMVVDDDGYNVESDATADKAIQSSMSTCTKAGRTNCHVYYSACSPAARIQ
ncbi:MAG: DUF4189 domain-containing protein [Rhodanobacter sp.]